MAFYYTIELAEAILEDRAFRGDADSLPDIMPSVLATGALLKHCFPEEFQVFDETVSHTPALVPTPRRNHFKSTFDGQGRQIDI